MQLLSTLTLGYACCFTQLRASRTPITSAIFVSISSPLWLRANMECYNKMWVFKNCTICINLNRIHEADENSKYIDFCNILNRNKSAILWYLKERIRDKVHEWDKKLLIKGDKEIFFNNCSPCPSKLWLEYFSITGWTLQRYEEDYVLILMEKFIK